MDYLKLINELNEELYERVGETEFDFNYSTNGYDEIISMGDIVLWNSANDEREYIEDKDDYEPLKPFIKRMLNNEVDKLVLLKF